jgi:MerR family transcriptional regulator, light-induced transcriptional regulator
VTEDSAETANPTDPGLDQIAARLARVYLDSLRAADGRGAYRVGRRALEEGIELPVLYQRVITPAMHEIGALWERGAITIADEHLATAITHRVLAALRPPIQVEFPHASESAKKPRAVLAAVEGEQHALGLRMAGDLLEDAGFHAVYLGADVPTEALLQAVASLAPDLLALSATMPEAGLKIREVEESLSSASPEVRLLIGGQAAAPRVSTRGAVVEDLEQLSEAVPPLS